MGYTYGFEKLEVWKLSFRLAKDIYNLTKIFPKEETYGLISQMRRCSVSISSNLAEGSGRTSYKDQARFSQISFGSAIELLNQLLLARALNFISEEQLSSTRLQIEELTNKINSLRNSQISKATEPKINYGQQINRSTNQQLNFFAHSSAVIDEGAKIGRGTKVWHFSHIMSAAEIGEYCNIGQNVFIADGVVLGNQVKVQNNVSIYNGVVCEDDVFLGPSMVFTNVNNPRSAVDRKAEYQATLVKKGASIGANATIVCGNTIGRFAFIGAGAVITKDVADYALVVGNPAQQIGWMSEHGCRLEFDEAGKAVCEQSGEGYKKEGMQVQKIKS